MLFNSIVAKFQTINETYLKCVFSVVEFFLPHKPDSRLEILDSIYNLENSYFQHLNWDIGSLQAANETFLRILFFG